MSANQKPFEIRHRYENRVLVTEQVPADCENPTLRAVVQAVERGANLVGADLYGANLRGAYLINANLRCANLIDADLRGAYLINASLINANLRGADLRGAVLPAGETWEQYLTVVLPALLTAGGKTLAEVAAAWDHHTWENCPIAVAFDAAGVNETPLLLHQRVREFVQFFDANMLPRPITEGVPTPACPVLA